MGDTWIADLSHFLDDEGRIAPTRGPVRQLAEHYAAIVIMVSRPELIVPREYRVRCRRRPGRKPCGGFIEADLVPDTEDIEWWRPDCGDNGYIQNWKGTMWDCTDAEELH